AALQRRRPGAAGLGPHHHPPRPGAGRRVAATKSAASSDLLSRRGGGAERLDPGRRMAGPARIVGNPLELHAASRRHLRLKLRITVIPAKAHYCPESVHVTTCGPLAVL